MAEQFDVAFRELRDESCGMLLLPMMPGPDIDKRRSELECLLPREAVKIARFTTAGPPARQPIEIHPFVFAPIDYCMQLFASNDHLPISAMNIRIYVYNLLNEYLESTYFVSTSDVEKGLRLPS
jgi:hypothetical protein